MRRRTVHFGFALAAALLAALAASQAAEWRQARQLAEMVEEPARAEAPTSPEAAII